MNRSHRSNHAMLPLTFALLMMGIFALVVIAANGPHKDDLSPTPGLMYHEAYGDQTAAGSDQGSYQPLPMPADAFSGGRMSASGNSMLAMADGMDSVEPLLTASDDPQVVALGQHWTADAAALRERGNWMITSATSSGMIHDPDRTREIDLQSLLRNGMAMASEGLAMRVHGEEMIEEIRQLQDQGVLPDDVATPLLAEAQQLVDLGELIEDDGEQMQQVAEDLLRSIGR